MAALPSTSILAGYRRWVEQRHGETVHSLGWWRLYSPTTTREARAAMSNDDLEADIAIFVGHLREFLGRRGLKSTTCRVLEIDDSASVDSYQVLAEVHIDPHNRDSLAVIASITTDGYIGAGLCPSPIQQDFRFVWGIEPQLRSFKAVQALVRQVSIGKIWVTFPRLSNILVGPRAMASASVIEDLEAAGLPAKSILHIRSNPLSFLRRVVKPAPWS